MKLSSQGKTTLVLLIGVLSMFLIIWGLSTLLQQSSSLENFKHASVATKYVPLEPSSLSSLGLTSLVEPSYSSIIYSIFYLFLIVYLGRFYYLAAIKQEERNFEIYQDAFKEKKQIPQQTDEEGESK